MPVGPPSPPSLPGHPLLTDTSICAFIQVSPGSCPAPLPPRLPTVCTQTVQLSCQPPHPPSRQCNMNSRPCPPETWLQRNRFAHRFPIGVAPRSAILSFKLALLVLIRFSMVFHPGDRGVGRKPTSFHLRARRDSRTPAVHPGRASPRSTPLPRPIDELDWDMSCDRGREKDSLMSQGTRRHYPPRGGTQEVDAGRPSERG
jgi:hypothetical protein